MVFISKEKLHVSAYSGHLLYNMPRPRGDVEISTSPRGLGILYKTLLARKLSEPEDGRYRPKHVVFPC